MSNKFRNQLTVIIFINIVTAIFTSCSNNNSKILGTWKKLDAADVATETFTADGDFTFKFESKSGTKATSGTSSGKYELKGDSLRLYDSPPKDGKNVCRAIGEISDDAANFTAFPSTGSTREINGKIEEI